MIETVLNDILAELKAIRREITVPDDVTVTVSDVVTVPVATSTVTTPPTAQTSTLIAETVTPPTITYEQVGQGIIKLAGSVSRDAAVGVLKNHGATLVKDLKPEQYPSVLEAVQALLKAAGK